MNLIKNWGFECFMEYDIGFMKVDLFVPHKNLVIEVDGLNHYIGAVKTNQDLKTHLRNLSIQRSNYVLMIFSIDDFNDKQMETNFIKELHSFLVSE